MKRFSIYALLLMSLGTLLVLIVGIQIITTSQQLHYQTLVDEQTSDDRQIEFLLETQAAAGVIRDDLLSGTTTELAQHLGEFRSALNEYLAIAPTTTSQDAATINDFMTLGQGITDSVQNYIGNPPAMGTGTSTPSTTATSTTAAISSLDAMRTQVDEMVSFESKESDMVHTAGQDQSDLIRVSVIVVSILGLLINIAVGIVLVRLIARPLRRLKAAAEAIARGETDFSLDIDSHDEIGQLAAAFKDMTGKLLASREALERQAKDNEAKALEFAEQVKQTSDTKAAIMNLLEDVDEEKNNAEKMVFERTKELREEKARLLASINALSFGFVLLDADDRVLLENPALTKILGTNEPVATMHDISKILRSPNSNIDLDIGASCRRCVELKAPVEFKVVPYGKKFLRVICAPIIENVSAIGYLFIVEDITEAKVMERSRDEFFAVASHELRTPLTAIRGNADMILDMYADKIVDTDMKEMLTDINSSSVRLINIVNDFLEVSRLEQGKLEVKKEVFDISDVIEKVMRDLKAIVEARGLSLVYTPPSTTLPQVRADKSRVEQVLVNLIGNAIKFTTKGSITVEVVTVPVDFVKVSVTDTGIGISEQNQNLLFRKFQQAGEQMLARDVTQGTGLGLYICSLLVSRMGGTIGLERSDLGKGSTFSFTIPIVM